MSSVLLGKILRFCCKNKNIRLTLDDIKKDPDFKYESEKEIVNLMQDVSCFFIVKQINDNLEINIDIDECQHVLVSMYVSMLFENKGA